MLRPSKWYWDVHHFAESLDITTEQANGFIKCIENGGMGTKADDIWRSNPAPYDAKVNLTNQCDNILNYTNTGNKSAVCGGIDEPLVAIFNQPSRHVCLGMINNRNKKITIQVQKDIVRYYVVGTHKHLIQHYPDVAKYRKKVWCDWIGC